MKKTYCDLCSVEIKEPVVVQGPIEELYQPPRQYNISPSLAPFIDIVVHHADLCFNCTLKKAEELLEGYGNA